MKQKWFTLLLQLFKKMKHNSAPTKLLTVFLFFAVLFAKPLFAQQNTLGISAIPPRVEITINPGEVTTTEIKVRNESKTEKQLSVSSEDFIVVDDMGTPLRIDTTDVEDNRWAAASWMQVSPSRLILKPGETKALVLTIIAPEDATPGGHYAMVLYNYNLETTLTQTGASIETKVGSLVYVTVPGEINENAKVTNFSATPAFSEYGPIDFKTTINNLSDIHITPVGSINISNMFGIKTKQINLDNTNIFPFTSRDFTNTLEKKFMFGRYKAQINAIYGQTGQLLTATQFFWVIPYKIIIGTIVVIILILLFVSKSKKSRQQQNRSSSDTPKVEALEKELEDLKRKYQDRK